MHHSLQSVAIMPMQRVLLKTSRSPKKARLSSGFGYEYYKFDYTGSNNWIGDLKKIPDLTATPVNAQMLATVENATEDLCYV